MKLKEHASTEKLRGGFYTPLIIAEFILRWGINNESNLSILEPSCGDGNFLKALKNLDLDYQKITAIEFDEIEFLKAKNFKLTSSEVINDDFHNYCLETKDKFDLIIGNPPYIRYQFFEKTQQDLAIQIFEKSGLNYSKLTNAWVSFVIGATQLLKNKGKIGFVLPAELLQVSYAKQLRIFLAHHFNKINIVSFEKLVFPEIQQEVVLLLCEKDGTTSHKIDHIELFDQNELQNLDLSSLQNPQKKIDFNSNKWTYYFLNQEEIDFLEKIGERKKLKNLGNFASVEVGITTGSNPFFTISKDIVEKYELEKYSFPMVGRSVQAKGIIFTLDDWFSNYNNKKIRSSLICFPEKSKSDLSLGANKYISLGEELKINKGYKTGIRKFWYSVPSQKKSDALFIRRNNQYPKLILNDAQAFTTDTMHRVNVKINYSLKAVIASYYNSLSFAFAEVCGRSHGGGVLELMPNEAENILLPYNPNNEKLLFDIEKRIRKGEDIQKILEFTDKVILKANFNFTDDEIKIANKIWIKLKNRRLNRGK